MTAEKIKGSAELIQDPTEAHVYANAVKPYIELLNKREFPSLNLKESQEHNLKRIADEEGEKARTPFVKEKLLGGIIVTEIGKHYLCEEGGDFKNEETPQAVEDLLKHFGQRKIDSIIREGTIDSRERITQISELNSVMNCGIAYAISHDKSPEKIVKILEPIQRKDDYVVYVMYGYFAAAIMIGEAPKSIEALVEIGKLENRSSTEVIQEHMPLILKLKQKYPEVNRLVHLNDGRRIGTLDFAMENQGFAWNRQTETYVYLNTNLQGRSL